MQTKIINADSMEHLKTLDENIFDSCVTDPPYHLASIVKRFGPGQKGINNQDEKEGRSGPYHRAAKGFMGETWDGGDIAFQKEFWEEVYRVIKPGAVCLAFAATRNYHRMAVALEDAGFEVVDMINWIYGTGFPKRRNLLKPAHEPICVARKGVNKELNLDDCRVPYRDENDRSGWHKTGSDGSKGYMGTDTFKIRKIGAEEIKERTKNGRWPANIIHDGLEDDWARYFYCAKASKKEKGDSGHPTVKPLELVKYLVRLITPKDGIVLDPFAGTGTTGEAAILEGRKYYLIEKTEKYLKDIKKRVGKPLLC
jgi:site-specific DNA-methyltransferase (adenine-specific)